MRLTFQAPSVCLVLGAVLVSAASGQTNVWVDPVNGSDAQAGTQAAPFKTITHALTTAVPSQQQTITLENGTYKAPAESFPLYMKTGQHLVGANECGAIIKHPSTPMSLLPIPTVSVQADPFGGSTISLFRNFEIRAPGKSGIKAESFAGESVDIIVDHVTLASSVKGIVVVANGGTAKLTTTDCDVTATDVAIRARSQNEGSAEVFVSKCSLRGNAGLHLHTINAGSNLESRTQDTAIHNCINGIFTQKGSGTTLTSHADHCVFTKNGLYSAPLPGGGGIVDATPRTPHTVQNCIFWDQVADRDMPSYNTISYTLTTNLVQQATLVAAPGGNFSGDPLFVDAAARDYHLTQASPAIGTATVSAGGSDFEGDPRPSGAGAQNDVGLDESYDTYVYALEDRIPIGTTATFRVFGPSGSAFQIYAGAPAAGAPGFSIPGVAQLAPGFFLFASGTVPVGSDHATISIPISSTPGLIGTSLSLQAVLFSPTLAVSYNVERVLLCN